MYIRRVEVIGLFNKFNTTIDFSEKCNILAGANGVGKSTVLNIIKCLIEADFITLVHYPFITIRIDYYLDNIDNTRSIEFARKDLIPDERRFIARCSKYLKQKYSGDNWELSYSDPRNTDTLSYHCIHEAYEKGWMYVFFDLSVTKSDRVQIIGAKYNLTRMERQASIEEIITIIEEFCISNHTRCFSDSKIERIIAMKRGVTDGFYSRWYISNSVPFGEMPIFYLDMVPSFRYSLQPAAPVYGNTTFDWIDSMRTVSLHDDAGDGYEYWADIKYLLGIPYKAFADAGSSITEAWRRILSGFDDIYPKKEVEQVQKEIIHELQEERIININTIIGLNYYSKEFVRDVNREYSQILSSLLTDSIEWDALYNGIFQKAINEVYESFPDKKDYFWNELLEQQPEVRRDIDRYLRPVFVDPALANRSNSDYEEITIAVYKLFIDRLRDKSNRNLLIDRLEKTLQKYIVTGEVKIYPSGIEVISHFTGERINLNALSSGEKRVVLLMVMACFMDGYTLILDEPELSLSVVWQKSILKDMLELGALSNITVATQSVFLAMDDSMRQYVRYLPQEEYHEE